jgi:hypothetical protein
MFGDMIIMFPKAFKKSHCDMNYFRIKQPFSDFANSNMFEAVLNHYFKLRLKPSFQVDLYDYDKGFLTVTGNDYMKTVSIDMDKFMSAWE